MRARVRAPVVRLSEMCLLVSSFLPHWAGVLASVALCACARRCARGASIEPVLVCQRGSASLVQNSGAPDRTLERSFVRACTILSNRKRSTKVSFSNIHVNGRAYNSVEDFTKNAKVCKSIKIQNYTKVHKAHIFWNVQKVC